MSTERRKALVTGAGRNLGRAIALRLAQSGCDVAVNARSNAAEAQSVAQSARAFGAQALVCLGDIGTREGVRRIADRALEGFGHVDILVNVAAWRPARKFLEMSYEEWQAVMDINVGGVFHLAQACLPAMVERRWGRIVNFSGMNSIRGHALRTHVAASKHAVWGLTKALAREFGPYNITANCISPGPAQSEHEDAAFDEKIRAQVVEIPLGRLGRAEEIAGAVAFLASEEGGFVSGQQIGVNGGAQT